MLYEISKIEAQTLLYVDQAANNPKSKRQGWCCLSQKKMQKDLGFIYPRDLRVVLSDLIQKCLLDCDIATGDLRMAIPELQDPHPPRRYKIGLETSEVLGTFQQTVALKEVVWYFKNVKK